ncbi:MAG TPA: hypothetical protein V6C72_04435 [Chroococcales cyanobacterium]
MMSLRTDPKSFQRLNIAELERMLLVEEPGYRTSTLELCMNAVKSFISKMLKN